MNQKNKEKEVQWGVIFIKANYLNGGLSIKGILWIIQKYLNSEFSRYVLTGGISFIVDFTVLSLFKEIFLKDILYSLYISTAMGFLAGVVTNYILCLNFVFLQAKQLNLGKRITDKILFVVIGIIGLIMNEICMHIGVEFLGIHYMIVKIITAAIVMVWNYIARKITIFSSKKQYEAKNINYTKEF